MEVSLEVWVSFKMLLRGAESGRGANISRERNIRLERKKLGRKSRGNVPDLIAR